MFVAERDASDMLQKRLRVLTDVVVQLTNKATRLQLASLPDAVPLAKLLVDEMEAPQGVRGITLEDVQQAVLRFVEVMEDLGDVPLDTSSRTVALSDAGSDACAGSYPVVALLNWITSVPHTDSNRYKNIIRMLFERLDENVSVTGHSWA